MGPSRAIDRATAAPWDGAAAPSFKIRSFVPAALLRSAVPAATPLIRLASWSMVQRAIGARGDPEDFAEYHVQVRLAGEPHGERHRTQAMFTAVEQHPRALGASP